jgi:hypothetical protein
MENKTKNLILASILIIFFTIIAVFINRPRVEIPEAEKVISQKGILFAGIGEESLLNQKLINELEEKFGNDVLESWSPIVFNDFPENFYNKFYPEISKLKKNLESKALQETSGENSIKIRYPYSYKKSEYFREIELTFSGLNKKPIIFRIKGYTHIDIIKDLNSKFGIPKKITENKINYKIWEKDNSVLIGVLKKDRVNETYLEITIYYMKNINAFFSEISSPDEEKKEKIF